MFVFRISSAQFFVVFFSVKNNECKVNEKNMSVFRDFEKLWQEKFPDSALSKDWESDIRASLNRHRDRIEALKDELENEKLYVQYLERLLTDVEKRRLDTIVAAGDHDGDMMRTAAEDMNFTTATAPPCESPDDLVSYLIYFISQYSISRKGKHSRKKINSLLVGVGLDSMSVCLWSDKSVLYVQQKGRSETWG